MNRQRGFSVLDVAFLLVIIVLLFVVGLRAADAYQAHFRFDCYDNQKALDAALWDVNSQNRREIWEVRAAYTVKYPGRPVPELVVVYQPRIGETEHVIQVITLDKLPGTICPLDQAKHVRPVINYWFCWGKWHCLYNEFHSE